MVQKNSKGLSDLQPSPDCEAWGVTASDRGVGDVDQESEKDYPFETTLTHSTHFSSNGRKLRGFLEKATSPGLGGKDGGSYGVSNVTA